MIYFIVFGNIAASMAQDAVQDQYGFLVSK
jgi:hypothetical protein